MSEVLSPSSRMLSVGIFVFDDVEVLDFAGPYEVFTTASRVQQRLQAGAVAPFSVFTVSSAGQAVRARAGLSVNPDYAFSSHPAIDVLLIPGGVVTQVLRMPEVTDWIKAMSAQAGLTASVCTGSFLLGQVGLLDGKTCTTHWEDVDDMRQMFPAVTVVDNRRWVDEGRLITSAGISAGIDMSLHLVERLAGRGLAEKTARQMDFDWQENV